MMRLFLASVLGLFMGLVWMMGCKPTSQQSLAVHVELTPKKINELRMNFRNDWVQLTCEGYPTTIIGSYEITEDTIAYAFVVDGDAVKDKDCYVDHMGEIADKPTSWYRWRTVGGAKLIRGSTKGRIEGGVLAVDFYEGAEFTYPSHLNLIADSQIRDHQGRATVTVVAASLHCPQETEAFQATLQASGLPQTFDRGFAEVKYVTPFVLNAQRSQRCYQTFTDDVGRTYRSHNWFVLDFRLDGDFRAVTYMYATDGKGLGAEGAP